MAAALGSQSCSKVILLAVEKIQIIEANTASVELSQFCKKLEKQRQSDKTVKQIENFNKIFFLCEL